ncbi:MAG: hypothetical protein KDC70_01215 [Saprospiraceae bacterium]|nr:hypothetical protein [Saprospiraceae bacterium]
MKKALLVLLLLVLTQCRKHDADSFLDTDPNYGLLILGKWKAYAPDMPGWHWTFGMKTARQYLPAYGTVLSDFTYTYQVIGDDIVLRNDTLPDRVIFATVINDTLIEFYEEMYGTGVSRRVYCRE